MVPSDAPNDVSRWPRHRFGVALCKIHRRDAHDPVFSALFNSLLVVGVALILVGAAIYVSCQWNFAIFGQGTPAPIDAPKKFVSRGLYQYVRNPMYLGVLTVILGWAVVLQTISLLWYALAVGTIFHLFVLIYEEPHLRRVFGREYEEYCSRVNRWLPRNAPAAE